MTPEERAARERALRAAYHVPDDEPIPDYVIDLVPLPGEPRPEPPTFDQLQWARCLSRCVVAERRLELAEAVVEAARKVSKFGGAWYHLQKALKAYDAACGRKP